MHRFVRLSLIVVCVGIAIMWVYALGFAPRESINRIGDAEWQAKAEAICQKAEDERFALQDLSPMKPNSVESLRKKADIVEKATDSLERAINEIEKIQPSDAKGQALVPLWLADYRTYLENRRTFIEQLRTVERRPYFAETEVEGVPISERIGKFARENDMKTCQPPRDLSV